MWDISKAFEFHVFQEAIYLSNGVLWICSTVVAIWMSEFTLSALSNLNRDVNTLFFTIQARRILKKRKIRDHLLMILSGCVWKEKEDPKERRKP